MLSNRQTNLPVREKVYRAHEICAPKQARQQAREHTREHTNATKKEKTDQPASQPASQLTNRLIEPKPSQQANPNSPAQTQPINQPNRTNEQTTKITANRPTQDRVLERRKPYTERASAGFCVTCVGSFTNPSTDPINRLAGLGQTAISRLRTGHCGLRAHLRQFGIMDSALCDCKEAEQTVHRILQDCPIWRKQRHQLWPQDESTTNKLWGTAEDLRRTTQFLATCGLRVSARLIDRRRRRRRKHTLSTPLANLSLTDLSGTSVWPC